MRRSAKAAKLTLDRAENPSPNPEAHHYLLPPGQVSRQSRRRWCCPTRSPPCFTASTTTDRLLLLERTQEPNLGKWSPPGGKVHTDRGESPYACACREAQEEMGLNLRPSDLHLTGLVSEDGYEGSTHWYIFLFEVLPHLAKLPPPCPEGRFGFFDNTEMAGLDVPRTDREKLWPLFQQHRGGFFSGHCHCLEGDDFEWTTEESCHD